MEHRTSSLHGQLLSASLTLCALALIAVTGWYYLRQRTAMEIAARQELLSVVQIKVQEITNWRSERLGDGRVLQSLSIARIARRTLSSPVMDPADRADLLDTMQELEREFLYTGAALVDRNGTIRLASNTGPADPSWIRDVGKATALEKNVSLQDLFWDAKLRRPLMALSVPVQGLGAFIFTIDPERFLYPLIRSWPVPSNTAAMSVGRIEGDELVSLSDLPGQPQTALRDRRPLRDFGNPDVLHSLKPRSIDHMPDYRGVPVLRIVQRIPDSPWYLLAKIDVAEIDSPMRHLAWEMAAIIGLIALANIAAVAFFWRNQQIRLYRESDRWLREVANGTPAYLWMGGVDGENKFINQPLAAFLGTNKEALGNDWTSFYHPDDAERVSQKYFNCFASRTECSDEARLRRYDGEYRWVIVTARPRFSCNGEFLGYAGSFLDVTERKMAEDAARRNAELVKGQNRVLELIAQDAPLHTTLNVLVSVIESLAPEMLASILLLDPDGLHLRHGAAPSLPEAYTKAIDGEPIGPMAGSCGTAAFRRELVVVEDIATDPLWQNYREFALSHGLRACWSTPIFDEKGPNGGNVLGTFALYFRSPGRPTPRHHELIQMATQTAAIAIATARAREALRASEERLRLATIYGNLGVWEWQLDSGRVIWSESLKAIFGLPAAGSELTRKMFQDAIHPDDRGRVEQALELALGNHVDYDAEYRICRPDGSLRWIASHGRAQYSAGGAPVRVLGIGRDITSRKRAEEEIMRREAQLVEAQSIAHLGSFEWDIGTDKVYRSAELCHIFGLTAEEFEPTFEGYLKRVHPEDRDSTKQLVERSFREASSFDHEVRIIRPDGTIRVLQSRGRFLCDEEGRAQKLVGTCHDITERKQVELKLLAANATLAYELKQRARYEREIQALSARLIRAQEEERTRLARELHDDLSQQIASLGISLSNLKREIPSKLVAARSQSDHIREKLTRLGEGVRRLSHELHPAILEHSGLVATLRAYCAEFSSLTKTHVAFRSDAAFADVNPNVALCAYRITQEALQNVVKHARTDQAQVALTRSDQKLIVTISDDGIGMDPNRARTGGGLGLTSIRERARLVNGNVDIESRPGHGTSVKVTLPL